MIENDIDEIVSKLIGRDAQKIDTGRRCLQRFVASYGNHIMGTVRIS